MDEDSTTHEHEDDGPGALARLLARHPLGAAVITLVVVMIVWRASVYNGSWFGADDFVYQTRAHQLGLSWKALNVNYFGQYMPGGFLLAFLDERVAPLGWQLIVLQTVLLTALAGWTFWRLLRTAFEPSFLLLLPFALYLLTPLTIPASNWWAASLNTLPLLAVMPLALTSHIKLLRTGRARHAVATVGWTAIGLAFFVKAILLAPVLVLLTVALRATARDSLTWQRALWRCRLEWALLLVLIPGYIALYLSAPTARNGSGLQVPDSLPELLSLYQKGLGHVLLPGMVGGPWRWVGTDAPTALSDVQFLPMFLSWLAVGAFVALACLLRRGAALVWLTVLLYACADLTFVAVGRLNQLNATLALESHYLADSLPLIWFAVAFSFLRVRGERGEPVRWMRVHAPAAVLRHRRTVAVGLATLVAISSVSSVHAFTVERQPRQAGRTFVETAKAQLAAAPDDLALYDRNVPQTLLSGLFLQYARTSNVLAPVTPDRLGARPYSLTSENPEVFDERGRLRPVVVKGTALQPGPKADCGWFVEGSTQALPLTGFVFDFDWTARIGYLAATDTTATFRFGRTKVTTRLHAGLGQVVFPVSGQGSSLSLEVPIGASVCIGDAQIGNLETKP